MVARAISGIILIIAVSALIWLGVGFGGFALWEWLSPHLGTAGAAAIVAFILLLGPISVAATLRLRRPAPRSDSALLALLAALGREKPIWIALGAALLGVIEAVFKRRK
jgi:hypothetical protein